MGRVLIIFVTVCALFVLSLFCAEEPSPKKKAETSLKIQRCAESEAQTTRIVLKDGGKSEIYGDGAEASLAGVNILGAGKYEISGVLKDGQIYAEAEEGLELVFDNVKVTSSKGAALTVMGKNAKLVLADGSVNKLADAYEYGGGEYTAGCVSAENSLVIGGSGTLLINGNYADGISCGEELRIEGGSVNVSAVRNALKGENIVLEGGDVVFV